MSYVCSIIIIVFALFSLGCEGSVKNMGQNNDNNADTSANGNRPINGKGSSTENITSPSVTPSIASSIKVRSSSPNTALDPRIKADSLLLGTNITNPTSLSGGWPMADIVKMSQPWRLNEGSGTFSIDLQNRITSISGDARLEKSVWSDNHPTLPRVGTYTVTVSGMKGVEVLAFPYTNFSSATTFTFEGSPGRILSLFVRAKGGVLATGELEISVVHEDDLVAYAQKGDITLNQAWLSQMRDRFQAKVTRAILPHEIYEQDFNTRTLPHAQSFAANIDRDTGLANEFGSLRLSFPLEVQIEIANEIGPEYFWWNIPPHASNDWMTQATQLVRDNLNPGIKVGLALGNEFWNQTPPFSHAGKFIRNYYRDKTLLSVAEGTSVVSGIHPFANGDVIYGMVNVNSGTFDNASHFLDNRDNENRFYAELTPFLVANSKANSFSLRNLDDNADYITPEGVSLVDFWLEDKAIDAPDYTVSSDTLTFQVDRVSGRRSADFFDIAVPILNAAGFETIRILEVQSDFVARTKEKTGVLGANGNYDKIALGIYFNSIEQFSDGDTIQDVHDDLLIAMKDAIQETVVAHAKAGYPASTQIFYEAGQHNMPNFDSPLFSQQEKIYYDYAISSLRGDLVDLFYTRLQQAGIRFGAITSMDNYVYGNFGYWGSKSRITDPDTGFALQIEEWGGVIKPQ